MTSRRIPESELILNPKGRIYHLNLEPDMVADTIVVVGDPERVPKVSRYFDKIDLQINNRELVTHTGFLGGKRVSVISSGMGTDNVELLMTELDALVNVDFQTRTVRKELRQLKIVRVGTSGCMQPDIPLDTLLVSRAALGLDSLMSFYERSTSEEQQITENKIQRVLELPFKPYIAEGSEVLFDLFKSTMYTGVTVTAPGFYAPQGREIRLRPKLPGFLETLAKTDTPWGRFTNFEMETAGYYAMAQLLGHEMISLNALIANRAQGTFSAQAEKTTQKLIELTLDKLSSF
ncbi:nucleoside phosphorylase [Roseivirga sp. UBA838]|uniref:nucleoside phosphorylase n=1 Tax=Roseivirga sp. UBA838 TaxID=1947393 RepID=UPI00257A3C20|nr:nucleoside phosphorylase [Roseivirga sp. UBA838]|tara:strand:- start:33714 stop:34586 length:873 start_codon:yes stop_codon:yes gene_type:complete